MHRRTTLGSAILFLLPGGHQAQAADDPLKDAREAFEKHQFQLARELLIPLAHAGEPEALFRLAIIYERGLGVEADPELAEQLYNGFCPIPLPD